MAIEVRHATRADLGTVARVLGGAFAADPTFGWVAGPSRAARLDRTLPAYFRGVLAQVLRRPDAEVQLTADERGAAVWLPSDRPWLSPLEQLRATPGAVRGLGQARGRRGLALEAVMHRHHPREPHHYLWFLGAAQGAQGQGLGSALLRAAVDRLDAQGVPAYLENSNPRNAPLYRRHGVLDRPALPLPDGCPPLVPMWRPVGG